MRPPLARQRTAQTRPALLRFFLQYLGTCEVPREQLEIEARLPSNWLDEEDDARFRSFLPRLVLVSKQLTGKENLGLEIGSRFHLCLAGMEGLVATHAPHALSGLQYFSDYVAVGDFVNMSWNTDETSVEIQANCVQSLPEKVCDEIIEAIFAGVVSVVRHLSSAEVNPVLLELQRSRPDNERKHAAVFRCPLTYRNSQAKLRFALTDLVQPSPLYEPMLFEQLKFTIDMKGYGTEHLGPMVKSVGTIVRGGVFELDAVAKAANLSPRTVQRRLSMEGSSFREVLIENRVEMGIRMLRETDASVEKIAQRLSYSDDKSFRRALKEITGKTPRQFR